MATTEQKATQIIQLEELRKHRDSTSLWIAIHDQVYDITQFLTEHPGGEEVLLEQGGGYATDAFEDVGHSSDARELMKKYHIGTLAEGSTESKKHKTNLTPSAPVADQGSSWFSWLIPLTVAVLAALAFRYFTT